MPTYQYVCANPDGKHDFEVVQSFSDAALSECPECSAPVRKVYGSVGVVFKGSGFYRTDSRSGSSSSKAAAASSTSAGSSDGNGGGTKKEAAAAASSSSSSSSSGTGAKAAGSN